MRIRRVLGAVFLIAALLLPILRLLFRDEWRRLHFECGWEWTFEHPEVVWIAGLMSLAAGAVLLVRDARKRPVISVLIGLGGCLLAILYCSILFLPGGEWRETDVDALQDEFGVILSGVSDPDPLRVMSFNIRYDNPGDRENRWGLRKDLVVDTIRAFDPDLLGLQEVLDHQGRFIRESFEGYGFVGVGRDDGVAAGEFAPVMYRKKRFELLDSGHFWLCETSEVPGSMGWDAACCRIATWARLRDRQAGRAILVLNTHWDHRGAAARLESAKQVKRFLDAQNDPVVVTGDFNAGFRSPPLKVLRESLVDAWRKSQKRPVVEAGTLHGFDGKDTGARIDWILCSEDFRPNSGTIDRTSRDGRYPSDHFPVNVVLSFN